MSDIKPIIAFIYIVVGLLVLVVLAVAHGAVGFYDDLLGWLNGKLDAVIDDCLGDE